jgi:uncharacterized protein
MTTTTTETASYVRYLTGYFSQPNYFQADPGLGTIRTPTGTRICALTDDFLRGFRSAVQFECGKATDRVFKKCGQRWGLAFIQRFDRELSQHYGVPLRDVSAGIVQKCLDEALRYHGWGKLTIDLTTYDQGVVQLIVHDPVMPEILGRSDKPTDSLMSGFFAAVFSHYAMQELDCQQTDCPSRGADASRFVVGLSERLQQVPNMVADNLSHSSIVRRLTTVAE